jgi:gamma-glutamylcyclotransferase (GGCT)/AIG2-like uncharacterized protein YtfP
LLIDPAILPAGRKSCGPSPSYRHFPHNRQRIILHLRYGRLLNRRATTMHTHYLFVYGTLQRGCANDITQKHPGVRYLGEGTVGGSLYELEGLPYPGILLNGGGPVAGEVYAVSEAVLNLLDAFEGFYPQQAGECFYFRKEADVLLNGALIRGFVYETNPQKFSLGGEIRPADWKAFIARNPSVTGRQETWPADLKGSA